MTIDDYPETHQTGHLIIHDDELLHTILDKVHSHEAIDFGVKIARDGRVWVCLNGTAFLRFKPTPTTTDPKNL